MLGLTAPARAELQFCNTTSYVLDLAIALPAENAPIQTPIAIERSFGSWNMWKIRESVEGARVAPAMPNAARLTMSMAGVVEKAANSEVTPNAAAPIIRSRRRP